jgi:hypothetical protein
LLLVVVLVLVVVVVVMVVVVVVMVVVVVVVVVVVAEISHAFIQGIYNYIPETNHVCRLYSVLANLQLQFMLHLRCFLR